MGGISLELDATGTNLDGTDPGTALALSAANGYALLEFSAPEADRSYVWAGSIDTEGQTAAVSKSENRTVTARYRLTGASDAALETAFNTLGKKVEKLTDEGGTLKFTTPAGTIGIFDIRAIGQSFAWDHRLLRIARAEVQLTLTCAPFIRAAAETDCGDNVETTLPALVFTEASIPGEVPALGRLVIDDDSGVNQWWLTWGVQSRYYSSASSAALFWEAETLTALGAAAVATGPSGASGGASNNVIQHTNLLSTYQPVLSTQASGGGAHMSHIGGFRVYARMLAPATNLGDVTVALEWSEGDFRTPTLNAATVLVDEPQANWRLVDLGVVVLNKVTAGTQAWQGRILAKSTADGDDLNVDYLLLVPVDEGSGIVSGIDRVTTPTSLSARDEFTSTTAGNALNARSAPVGGTWATSGAATDFVFADPAGGMATEHITRSATSGARYAVLGSTDFTNVRVDMLASADSATVATEYAVIARWTDASNALFGHAIPQGDGVTVQLVLGTVVAGSGAAIKTRMIRVNASADVQSLRLSLLAYTTGRAILVAFHPTTGVELGRVGGWSTHLATGGALATGKPVLMDAGIGATARRYDEFAVSVPVPDAAIFASQSLALRHDSARREDSGGTLWVKPSSYVGDYLRVPPAGAEGRTARVIVKATRADPFTESDPAIDDISARLFVTPRWRTVPD